MPTVAELAALDVQHIAWLLVIEGVPFCFTSRSDLAGAGGGSWIGTSEGPRVVRAGLEMQGNLSAAVRIGAGDDAGMLTDDGYTFKVRDLDDDLLALFAKPDTVDTLASHLAPTDDPAPSDGIDAQGNAVALWGRYVGAEAIGPAGERRYYACLPGSTLPGLDHAALAGEEVGMLAPVEVTDAPQFREGRRVALYLLRRDPFGTNGSEIANWSSWADQYAGGALVWWGQLRRGTQVGKDWSLACSGPASWLGKTLNANAPSDWRRATPIFALSQATKRHEDRVAVMLTTYDPATNVTSYHGQKVFDAGDDLGPTPNKDQVVTALSSLVSGLNSIPGSEGAFEDAFDSFADFDDTFVSVRINDQGGVLPSSATMRMVLHEKVWRLLGWEPQQQLELIGAGFNSDPQAVLFEQVTTIYTPDPTPTPGPGFWQATFSTFPAFFGVAPPGFAYDNDGAKRIYQPLSGEGAYVLASDPGQEISDGYSPVFIDGQLARPPTDGLQVDGDATTSMRWVLMSARVRKPGDEDPTELRMVARVEWAGTETLTAAAEGDYRFVVAEYYDPKHFGHPGRRLKAPISVPATADDDVSLRWVPLGVFGYNSGFAGFDNVARILPRILLSTGTATWSGDELVAGDNAHPDSGIIDTDAEIADLSLAIPADLVDLDSIRDAAEANPGGLGGTLNKVRLAYVGAVSSEEVIRAIIGPRHWAMSLRGNRYGLFSWTAPLSYEDVDVVIGTSDVADDGPPQVDLRPVAPVDKALLTYGQGEEQVDPQTYEYQAVSHDAGRAARNGRHIVELTGRGLPAPQRWVDVEEPTPASWSRAWAELWSERVGPWAASSMLSIRTRVRPPKSLQLQVGSIVRITNPWPATTLGVYGLSNALGRVTAAELEPDTLCATVEILVHPRDLDLARRFAPIARVVDEVATLEERFDVETGILSCHADAFDRGGSISDVAYFAEPAWLNIGGDAKVEVWQWDGVTWEQTLTGMVASVDTTAHTITLSDVTGTFWERRYAFVVLQPWASQDSDSWVREFFSVTTDPDGTFGAETGWKFYK